MSDPEQMLKVLKTHTIKSHLGLDREGIRGGLIADSEYVWFTNGANIVLYSKITGCVESSRSFGGNAQTSNPIEITFVQELHNEEKTMNMLLVGCLCKSFGILFVCQFPTLMIIRCIHTPSPISYISTINNESLPQNQLSDKFKVMSTILLVGLATGVVFAVDMRKHYIENQLRNIEIMVSESSPSKLLILRKNEDIQEAKKISDHNDLHLAIFINEQFCNFYKKQYSGKLNFGISCLLYTEEINAIAIGYNTGHFQLWDCKMMQTLYILNKPECFMPITHITFLEQADQSNKLCYLWIIQSDNSSLPNAMMIALSYEHRIMMSNGHSSYRVYKDYKIALKMSLRKESGIGRCISALTLCNGALARKNNDVSKNVGITLLAMFMEIRQNLDASPKSYIFLFDINQWYKAKMPLITFNNLKVSNAYASFVKLPDCASYLDFNISNKTLVSFGSTFKNNVNKFFYPSSIYFECDCLLDTEIIRYKHVGVQQEVLNKLILKNRNIFLNPSLFYRQCLQTNLRPFFFYITCDNKCCSLFDQLHFTVSILIENNLMSVFDKYVVKWKKETISEVRVLHLVQCLWSHINLVKQYADQLCVPLFDCSGTLVGEKNIRMLNDCFSQMLRIENLFKRMQLTDCIKITFVDLVDRVKIINCVTQYLNAIIYFLNVELLPKQLQDPSKILSDFTSIIQYATKRRMEFGDLPLYIIDAIVANEPNGNKLIEQWKHECIEETKGLYPPSDIQCLLRIYLNVELSNQIKDFIILYFLIDVCSVLKADEITTNIFDNAFVKNNELYKLCCASWLFDHDMFEDAMLILASNNEWMVNDMTWNWYHWTVLKLFEFKNQYYWALIYLDLFGVKLVNLDDHKFYVNLQIMNKRCFDAILYLRKVQEKKILFEYIFDRCRHTNQLIEFLSFSLDSDEKKLFFSCLKKFEDTKLIQFMFLVQEKRFSEALELSKSLKDKTNSKYENIFKIASALVGNIKDYTSSDHENNLDKKVFSNEDMTLMKCFIDIQLNTMNSNTCRDNDKSDQINLIQPNGDDNNMNKDETQVLGEKVSLINEVLNPTKIEPSKKIRVDLLKLLDTPFIENVSYLPSTTNRVAVPKQKSETDHEQLSRILTFDFPDYNDNVVEKSTQKEGVSMKKIDPENENLGNNDTNNLPINVIANQTLFTFHNCLDNTEIKILETVPTSYTEKREEYEKMDISDNDLSDIIDGEDEVNFKESNVILDNVVCVENNSDYPIILPDDAEVNFEKFYIINVNDNNVSEKHDVILENDQLLENHSEQPSVSLNYHYENNSKNADIMLDEVNDNVNAEQLNAILNRDIEENLEVSDAIFDNDQCVEIKTNQHCVINNDEYENNLEASYFSFDGSNYTNNSERQDFILGDDPIVGNYSYQHSLIPNNEDENNLVEPNFIPDVDNENNLKEPDILNDANGNNNSEQSDVLPEGDNNENLGESDSILGDDPILENYSYLLYFVRNDEGENNLEEPNFIPDVDNKINFKEPDILNDANGNNNSEQSDVLPEGDNNESLGESNFILGDDSIVGNYSYPHSVIRNAEGENNLEEPNFISDVDNENNLKEPNILNGANGNNNSVQSDVLPEGDNNANLGESDFLLGDDPIVGNYSYQLSVIRNDEDENNLKEPNFISDVDNENNLKEPDILNDANGNNISEQTDVLPEGDNNESLGESNFILGDDPIVGNYSYPHSVIRNAEGENNLEEPNFISDVDNENNLKEPNILNGANGNNNSEQSDVLPEGDNNTNLGESDFLLGNDPIVGNYSYQLSVIRNDEDENNLKEPNFISDVDNENNLKEPDILNDANGNNISEQTDVLPKGDNNENLGETDIILDDDQIEENHSDQRSIIPDYGNGQNLAELNVLLKNENEDSLKESDFILKGENYKNIEKQNTLLDDTNDYNYSIQSDVLIYSPSVQNHSDQLNVISDCKNENSLVEPSAMLDSGNKNNSEEAYASEQNLIKPFETLKNEKTAINHYVEVRGNGIYPTDSQSNTLDNLTLSIYGLPEENHSNNDNKIIEEVNKNDLCNKIGGKNTSFAVKKDDNAKVGENADTDNRSSAPNNFQIIENHKEDLSNDQNEDCLYDEYQFSNNEVFPELSSNCQEFNPIPEDGFDHLTMTGNESNQLEMYAILNQPTSVLLNESFSSKINLGTTIEVNEIPRDLVVDNNVKIVSNEISKDFEPSSSNTNIITNLCNQDIKSFQLVESKNQQVDTNILNYATKEYSVEIQNSCPAASSQLSKILGIEEFSQNNILNNDILAQEETSKSYSLVTNSLDTESGNHLAENLHNNRKNDENKQPFAEQIDKNIPNLRKRRNWTKCILVTDTKLTAKSRSKSNTKQVELKTISSTSSNIFENCPKSISNKRSKCQKQIALKRRKVFPKSDSIVGASNSKIDSKQISEESTKNTVKMSKKIEELVTNNLSYKNKKTVSQEKLKKIVMPVEIKQDSENSNKTLNQNFFSCSKMTNQLFFQEPKIILERINVSSLYKNCFNKLAMVSDSGQISSSVDETNDHKTITLKRLRSGCLKSMKEPTATNTIINLDEKPKKDSINNKRNKVVSNKLKLNSSYKIKKVKFDKNLKSCPDRLVMTFSKSDPINCVNKIPNSPITETINLISDDEFVSDKVQEEMDKTSSDMEKLDWKIISHEAKTNTDAIPKILIRRNKSDLNTNCIFSQLDLKPIKQGTKIVQEQELDHVKKSSESKILKLNQQVRRTSSRKILKKQTCSCCTSNLMDVDCSSNVE